MSTGLSGLSVGVITVGGLLVYAGIRGVSPLQALRDVSSGQPPPVANRTTGGDVSQQGAVTTGALSAGSFVSDKYSQLRRTQPGYSDCSSFVCKIYHAKGIAKPDGRMEWPNTTAFANSPAWQTVARADTVPGDIAVKTNALGKNHMVMITASGAAEGIGQQNPTVNVRTGSMETLFANVSGTLIYRHYVGVWEG